MITWQTDKGLQKIRGLYFFNASARSTLSFFPTSPPPRVLDLVWFSGSPDPIKEVQLFTSVIDDTRVLVHTGCWRFENGIV